MINIKAPEETRMSRIGKKPIPVPNGVTIDLKGSHLVVKGPKGTLEQSFRPEVDIKQEDGNIVVERPVESKMHRSLHGRQGRQGWREEVRAISCCVFIHTQ